MYWKMRMPLILASFGIIAGLFERFFTVFMINASYYTRSASYLIIVGSIIFILEKTGINEKRVHALIGVVIILFAVVFEGFMSTVA
ncbi:hypothetical protein DES38_104250 [Streptohalobacillus salinus]|uniref:EamA-like transporter family protein n=1 Tax=Streptohalobacillus salinus TaxID=621096 RepID=A0A2V3WHL2_9BACI|nr:hypothetical protein [Streptohalobacillus salinus]PXW91815.1 hypothetical protein DES38_104250 [Streptohalobacillus salinus]